MIHKVASAEGKVLELVSFHMSGLVACGASMRMGGARATLRKILRDILSERLEIRIGFPQAKAQRDFLYDLLLPGSGEDHSKSKSRDSLRARRQRCILDHKLNGDISEANTVVHWSLTWVSRDQMLQEFERFAIPALIPTTCPLLNRSRLLNFMEATSWVTMLCVHHDLFSEVMERFYGHSVLPLDPASLSAPSSKIPDLLADHAFTAELTTQHEVDTENFSWSEYNKATQKKAAKYAKTFPGPLLTVIQVIMMPLVDLMVKLIYLASEQFEKDQESRSLQGKPRLYRIVEFANGKLQDSFTEKLNSLLHAIPAWLPAGVSRQSVQVLMFRMISRAGTMVRQLLMFSFYKAICSLL